MKTSQLAQRIRREFRVIASVYPAQLPPIERPFDGTTLFTIDPCAKGQPAQLLKIVDAVQFSKDPLSRDVTNENLILVDHIARDLIEHWARTPLGAPAGSGPGVGLLEGDAPTDAELAALYARQEVMFEYHYQDGLRLAQNQEWRGINHNHRLAAKWLDREEPWAIDTSKPAGPAMKECPACFMLIPKLASFCAHCRNQIAEMPAELAALQPGAKRKAA